MSTKPATDANAVFQRLKRQCLTDNINENEIILLLRPVNPEKENNTVLFNRAHLDIPGAAEIALDCLQEMKTSIILTSLLPDGRETHREQFRFNKDGSVRDCSRDRFIAKMILLTENAITIATQTETQMLSTYVSALGFDNKRPK